MQFRKKPADEAGKTERMDVEDRYIDAITTQKVLKQLQENNKYQQTPQSEKTDR